MLSKLHVAEQELAARKLLVRASDLFAILAPEVRLALRPAEARVEALLGPAEPVDLSGGELDAWIETFRVLQASEAWATHATWITTTKPAFGPGVKERFAAAARLDPAAVADAQSRREAIRARLGLRIPSDVVVLAPVAIGAAMPREAPADAMEKFRSGTLSLLCAAGHAGFPQLVFPFATLDGYPLGLSLIGARDADEVLIDLAVALGPVSSDAVEP